MVEENRVKYRQLSFKIWGKRKDYIAKGSSQDG